MQLILLSHLSQKTSCILGYLYIDDFQSEEFIAYSLCLIFGLVQAHQVESFIDSANKINAMMLEFAAKLAFIHRTTNIGAQNIDGSIVEIYNIVLARFQHQDSFKKIRFFEKTFLLANISMEIVLGKFFSSFYNANFQFSA